MDTTRQRGYAPQRRHPRCILLMAGYTQAERASAGLVSARSQILLEGMVFEGNWGLRGENEKG